MLAKQEQKIEAPELSLEMWDYVFSFLGAQDLCNIELVSRTWQQLASSEVVWKRNTEHSKEKFRELATRPVYTILTIPFKLLPGCIKQTNFEIVEEEMHCLFNNPKSLKLCQWPQKVGDELAKSGKNIPDNGIFNSKEELEYAWSQTQKSFMFVTTDPKQGKFFIEHKQVKDKIYITALKYFMHKEYTTLKEPIVLNRAQIKNFPPAPVKKALPSVTTPGRNDAQFFQQQPLSQNASINQAPEKSKKSRCTIS